MRQSNQAIRSTVAVVVSGGRYRPLGAQLMPLLRPKLEAEPNCWHSKPVTCQHLMREAMGPSKRYLFERFEAGCRNRTLMSTQALTDSDRYRDGLEKCEKL